MVAIGWEIRQIKDIDCVGQKFYKDFNITMKWSARTTAPRSRREFSNEYLLAKFGFDTAENEPYKVCPLSAYRSPRSTSESV